MTVPPDEYFALTAHFTAGRLYGVDETVTLVRLSSHCRSSRLFLTFNLGPFLWLCGSSLHSVLSSTFGSVGRFSMFGERNLILLISHSEG